jgi:hypothetical protein
MELALHRKYKLISESIMWWFTCCLDLLVLLADYLFLANKICLKESRGRHGRDRMVDVLRLHVQSVHKSTNVVSWNPAHGEMYSIQHYVIKFASDMQKVILFPPPIKWLPRYFQLLLKVVLSTITLTQRVKLCPLRIRYFNYVTNLDVSDLNVWSLLISSA